MRPWIAHTRIQPLWCAHFARGRDCNDDGDEIARAMAARDPDRGSGGPACSLARAAACAGGCRALVWRADGGADEREAGGSAFDRISTPAYRGNSGPAAYL